MVFILAIILFTDQVGVRHLHVLMAFLAVTIAYITRINLSVAIVAMTDKSTANPNFQVSGRSKIKMRNSFQRNPARKAKNIFSPIAILWSRNYSYFDFLPCDNRECVVPKVSNSAFVEIESAN